MLVSSKPYSTEEADPSDVNSIVRRLLEDFPIDFPLAMELGGLRLLAAPEISRLLVSAQGYLERRSDRHAAALGAALELLRHGCEGPVGRRILAAIGEAHSRHAIPVELELYSLSVLVLDPVRWIARYGWRPIESAEREALAHFWHNAALRMGLPDPPQGFSDWEVFQRETERRLHGAAAENHRMVDIACREFAQRFPRGSRGMAKLIVSSLIDSSLHAHLGLPHPRRSMRALIHGAFRLRRRAMAALAPIRNSWWSGRWALPELRAAELGGTIVSSAKA